MFKVTLKLVTSVRMLIGKSHPPWDDHSNHSIVYFLGNRFNYSFVSLLRNMCSVVCSAVWEENSTHLLVLTDADADPVSPLTMWELL